VTNSANRTSSVNSRKNGLLRSVAPSIFRVNRTSSVIRLFRQVEQCLSLSCSIYHKISHETLAFSLYTHSTEVFIPKKFKWLLGYSYSIRGSPPFCYFPIAKFVHYPCHLELWKTQPKQKCGWAIAHPPYPRSLISFAVFFFFGGGGVEMPVISHPQLNPRGIRLKAEDASHFRPTFQASSETQEQLVEVTRYFRTTWCSRAKVYSLMVNFRPQISHRPKISRRLTAPGSPRKTFQLQVLTASSEKAPWADSARGWPAASYSNSRWRTVSVFQSRFRMTLLELFSLSRVYAGNYLHTCTTAYNKGTDCNSHWVTMRFLFVNFR